MKLMKKQERRPGAATSASDSAGGAIDRRTFLRRSGLALGGVAAASALPFSMMKKAGAKTAADIDPKAEITRVRTICTHCSVGCGVIAEVQQGVWTRQEPAFDHPFNLGAHCAKGASIREHGHGDRRLKYPTKMENGKWKRISWDQAINEIGDQILGIRKKSGPDGVFWVGSSKYNNEQAYLLRKFVSLWGSNNCDHQARICHSTTVTGVANTWGYGAMTNSYNDMHNSKAMLFIGSNAAEAHPVAMQHILRGKENGAKMIVCDPRFTRTAAHADQYVRLRSGTDVALVWGILWHVFENGWEDKQYISQRVYGMDEVRAEVKKYPPEVVQDITGVPREEVYKVAKTMADNRPGTLVWCMGGTQHHYGINNTRAYCILQLALGNIGVSGGGANIFRGHDNVQGATDVGPNPDSLPGYYGIAEGAWKHWAAVWGLDYEWIKSRFDQAEYDDGKGGKIKPMEMGGMTVSRWIDGVLENKANISQRDNIRALFYWGHAPNSQTRGPEMKKAMEKLDLLVVIDPYPTVSAVLHDRKESTYLLPACTQLETYGSVVASNRSLQWRDKVIEPLFESLPDHTIMYKFAKKLGFAQQLAKNYKVTKDEPLIEDILREINRGTWTIGYSGQSPERLKLHQKNWGTFNTTTLRAEGGPANGDFYGLPWPCWGTPQMKHPGTHVLYNTSLPVAKGGGTFRANFGTERNGVTLLAQNSWSAGSDIKDGYPEFTADMLKKLGWWEDLTAAEKTAAEGKNWKTDLSGGIIRVAIKHGCMPFGNAKARTVVWQFPDPVPTHREPLYSPRYDLVKKWPTIADRKLYMRLPTRYASVQAKDNSKEFPLIHTSGRLTEYEGGGDETRSNPWLAELQQDMFVEINPTDANNARVRDGQLVWLEGPEGGHIKIKAMVTRRVAAGTVFTPYHFGGHFQGKDLRDKYPQGSDPYVLGDSTNTATTYGYDMVTMMQETKTTLCRIRPA